MADEYDLQQSLQDQSDSFLAQNRTYAWVADSNNGSYAGGSQIVITRGTWIYELLHDKYLPEFAIPLASITI